MRSKRVWGWDKVLLVSTRIDLLSSEYCTTLNGNTGGEVVHGRWMTAPRACSQLRIR